MNLAINDACMKTAKDIFELATNPVSQWKKASPLERLVCLKKVTSNPVLDGQTLRYEMKKLLSLLSEMKGFSDWSGKLDDLRTAILEYAAAA